MQPFQVFVCTGSNMGNRRANLDFAARKCAEAFGELTGSSAIYETEAWGITDQNSFFNQVLQFYTTMTPEQVLETVLGMEHLMGRERNEKWGPRTIDIDILFYGNEIVDHPGLHIPHPQLAQRRFVLEPLAEIAPDFMHPVLGKTVKWLLENCPDTLGTRRLPEESGSTTIF